MNHSLSMIRSLANRKMIADFIRNSPMPVGLDAERLDLLELLKQWQTGTLHGFVQQFPAIDPARPSSSIHNPQSPTSH